MPSSATSHTSQYKEPKEPPLVVKVPALQSFEPCMLLEMNLERERRQLVFHIKTAQTSEQVRALKTAVKTWLEKDPEDAVIKRAGRELKKKEAWLKMKGEWH